jgi:CubicO group peptidase (beta-lactamase class C family)
VRRMLLDPLGMPTATFEPTVAMTYPLALDHRVRGDTVSVLRPFQDDASTWPSGSLFASAEELARFAAALSNRGMLDGRQVIPPAVIQAAMEPIARSPGPDSVRCGYGLGISSCTRNGRRLVSHYGFRVGSGAVLTVAPDSGFAVVILANRNGAIMHQTEQAVLDAVFGATPPEQPEAKKAMTRADATRWAGTYVMGRDTIQLRAKSDSLWYEYGATAPLVCATDASGALLVLDAEGNVAQQFLLVPAKSGAVYMHDGLTAFRRVARRPVRATTSGGRTPF